MWCPPLCARPMAIGLCRSGPFFESVRLWARWGECGTCGWPNRCGTSEWFVPGGGAGMRWNIRILLAAVMLATLTPAAAARQSVPAEQVKQEELALPSPWLFTLRRHYARGDAAALVRTAKELLADLTLRKFDSSCCDYERHFYEVVFTGFDAAEKETLVRLLIHEPDPEQ